MGQNGLPIDLDCDHPSCAESHGSVKVNDAVIRDSFSRPGKILRVQAVVNGFPYVGESSEDFKIYQQFVVVGKFVKTLFGWRYVP